MVGYPIFYVLKLSLAHSTLARNLHSLVLFGSVRVLEVDGLQVVFECVAPRKDTGVVTAVVRGRTIISRNCCVLEGAFKLALVTADFLPVALDVSKQVVGPGKATVAIFTDMGSQCWL